MVLKTYDRRHYFLSERELVPNCIEVPPKIKIRKLALQVKLPYFLHFLNSGLYMLTWKQF